MPNPVTLIPEVEQMVGEMIDDHLEISQTPQDELSTVEHITQSDKLTSELKAATLSMIRDATLPRFLRFINGVKEQTGLDYFTASNAIYLHSLIHNNEITMQGNDKSFYNHNFSCFYGSSLNDEDKASIYEAIQQRFNQKLNDVITQQDYQIDDQQMQTTQQSYVIAGTPDAFGSEPQWLRDQPYCKNHAIIVPYKQLEYILNHPDQFNETALEQNLQEVIQDGSEVVLQNFLNISNESPLQKAYDNGSEALIHKLIDTGIFQSMDFMQLQDVAEQVLESSLPLAHSLILTNRPQALNYLSQEELTATDNQQQTVLHYAVFQNNPDVTRQLLDNLTARALINQKDGCSNTALHLAIEQDCQAITQQLLNCDDIKVAQKNRVGQGESPLQVAARKGKRDLVQTMLRHSSTDIEHVREASGSHDLVPNNLDNQNIFNNTIDKLIQNAQNNQLSTHSQAFHQSGYRTMPTIGSQEDNNPNNGCTLM